MPTYLLIQIILVYSLFSFTDEPSHNASIRDEKIENMTSEDKHKSTYPSESPSLLEETNEATKSHQKGNSSVKEGDSGVLFPSIPYENSQDSHSSLNGTT
ncbi:hypothetical protein K7432_002671, partial [Basidiobolus ranarum]